MRAVLLALALAALPAAGRAQSGAAPEPVPGHELRDRDFGVSIKGFGLDRRVEMYQWRREDDGRLHTVWNDALIESDDFPETQRNPARIPLPGRRWWSQDARLEGHPLDVEVLQTLGRWDVFRPDFSRLPANLAASFQPEGDGLGSSDDPASPRVGDLRIRWRRLVLPPLTGRVQLREGRWQVTPEAERVAVRTATDPTVDVSGTDEEFAQRWWPRLVAVTLGVLVFVVVSRRLWWRHRARR